MTVTAPSPADSRASADPSGPSPERVEGDPASPAVSSGHGPAAQLVARLAPPVLVAIVFVGLWHVVSTRVLDPDRRFLLPSPGDVVSVGFADAANREELLVGLLHTARVAVVGLAIAIVLGTVFAVIMSQARWVERSFYPWAVVLQTIPTLALVPLIGFWFKFGFNSRVLVCVLISLFPIITNTLFGLKSADAAHHDLFTLHRATRWQRLAKLTLPGALPSMFAGWRISAGLSVIGAIVGDFFFRQGDAGLGRLIDGYTANLQSEQLFATVVVSSLFGLVVFLAFGALTRLVVGSWHQSAGPAEH